MVFGALALPLELPQQITLTGDLTSRDSVQIIWINHFGPVYIGR